MQQYNRANIDGFKKDLRRIHELLVNKIEKGDAIDLIWSIFRDGLLRCVDENVPCKQRRIKPPHEPCWFDLSAKKACRKRRRFYIRFKSSWKSHHKSAYKSLRRDNKKLFRKL